jgi:hypothetical protein
VRSVAGHRRIDQHGRSWAAQLAGGFCELQEPSVAQADRALARLADTVTFGDPMADVARAGLARVTGRDFQKGIKAGR